MGSPNSLGLSISFYHLLVPWCFASHKADSMSFLYAMNRSVSLSNSSLN